MREFLQKINFNEIFYDKNKYFAHRDSISNNFKETIYEHSMNTLIVADYFIKKDNYRIINTINNLFIEHSKVDSTNSFRFFLDTFYMSVLFHDLGKYNQIFQNEKMNNNILNDKLNIEGDSSHSPYSNIQEHLKTFTIDFKTTNKRELRSIDKFLKNYFTIMEILVLKHHSGLNTITATESSALCEINYLFGNELNIIIDLLFSILVQSDMLSTTYYMTTQKERLDYNNIESLENVFNEYLDKKLARIDPEEIRTIENKKDYNKSIYESLRTYSKEDLMTSQSLSELKHMVASNVVNSDNFGDIRIFNGNTGIGKTNISMLYINELVKRENVSKVIYSLPLNILIDQTQEEILKAFDFDKNRVSIINSEHTPEYKIGEISTNYWGLKYDFDNFNHEIVLTSSVNFFHKLFHKDKRSKLSLINLQDSLLIIDEVQLLDDRYFELIYKYLIVLNKYLNVKILILSATLPIPKLFYSQFDNKSILSEEINDTILKHRFFDRYEFDYSEFKGDNSFISDYINNSETENNFLITHNSIRKCNDLYKTLKLNKEISVFFYNNTIVKPILSKIIDLVRANTNKKIVVISTMKIETGVDISFDVGFKFSSSIDSIQQFAGRINRYGKRVKSKVFILRDDKLKIYGKTQERSKITKNNAQDVNHYKTYLTNIDSYYDKLFELSNSENLNSFENMKFEELNKIKLIDNDYLQTLFFIHCEDVRLILSELDLLLYRKYFKSFNNKEISMIYKNKFFSLNKEIKYLFKLFTFSGYISNTSNFYKNILSKEQISIIKESSNEIIESYIIINEKDYFYNINRGLDTNKDIDIDDIEDLVNSI